ncbi:predicted protein [Sclerotinia sclerotiorum 1980 UF-70]|uniref:Uncharacterized protein n=1 Tax=Sclerotinia sclerotiorum (strain ATCC 18683 / 1980 / Ss-1) TaxID=665079 RepID=A7E9N5_SCLS1|nr:predicted protein [Sclerotinia sclerotiorum 1980 UF-70]EDN97087.1 predicted protein [Sclerotinia sclerotiorum 1980 UF-70]
MAEVLTPSFKAFNLKTASTCGCVNRWLCDNEARAVEIWILFVSAYDECTYMVRVRDLTMMADDDNPFSCLEA